MPEIRHKAEIYVNYDEAQTRQNLSSGEEIRTVFGKIKKWFADMGTAAFKDVPSSGNAGNSEVVLGNDSRLSDARTPTAHNQAANTITVMTGYSKPQSTSAISASDTLNGAVGKLEKGLENKVTSVSYDTTNKKITKTVNGTTTDVVTTATLKSDMGVPNAMTGATSSANGTVGYVNAVPPKDGYNTKYLRADGTWTVPPDTNTDTKVTSAANHYAPATVSGQDKTASASGATAAWSIDVVKGVTLNTDGKGHVTGMSVTSGKLPANPNTDRYVNSASFADDTTNSANSPVKMTLTRAGSDSATVTGNIPKVSSASAGVVPKGTTVSSQSQTTKFLREDGTWAAPSYTTNTDTKVTSSANHYTPSTVSGQDKTASASGATAAWSIDVVKGVTLNTDGKGHVTGLSVTSGKIPANPNTDTKVTSVGNHYTPTEDAGAVISKDASSTTAATWNSTSLVTGVDIKRDAKGHVVDIALDSIKMPANPNTDTTYTVATGDANGQIKVTPSSGSAYNVSVKGLGTAAYTASTAYAVSKTLTNEDLNSVTTPGFYNAGGSNSVTNKPSGVDAFGLEVVHSASGAYYTQKIYLYTSAIPYRRVCNNGTWSSWTLDKLTDTTYSAGTGIALSGTTFNNSGVRSISTGSSNGTISVNTNGTSADVNVKGLADLAYIAKGSDTTKYLRNDGTWAVPPDNNTWTAMTGATSSANGTVGYVNAVPPKDGYNTKYLRADGTWVVPPDTNTKVTSSANHYAPATVSGQDKTASASGATAAWEIDVVKGVTLNTDGKGHVTGLSVTSGKIPANPNTDTKVTQTADDSTNSNFEVIFSNTADNTTRTETSKKSSKLKFNPSTGNLQATQLNGVTIGSSPKFTDTTYSTVSKTATGLCPQLPNETTTTKYLRQDGTWQVPPDNNTNYYHTTGSWSGLTYTATANGGAGALAFTIPTGTTATTVCVGNDSRLSNARTPTAHNQASNTINAMTSYSKPSSTSAITTSDTLNGAIGKLEKGLDNVNATIGDINTILEEVL